MESFKRQLVELSVELEDRTKQCEVLAERIDQERVKLTFVDEDCNQEYEHKMQVIADSQKHTSDSLKAKYEQLQEQKAALVTTVKQQVQEDDERAKELQKQARKLYDEVTAVIEVNRKAHRAGLEDRLQKAMSNKYNEIYESTAKASQPEFQRMQLRHEEEISDLERQEQRAERLLRQEMQSNLNKLVEQEEVEAKEEFLHQIRMKNENFHRQIQDLEKDGRVRLERSKEEHEQLHEKELSSIRKKSEKLKMQQKEDVQRAQQESLNVLKGHKRTHLEELQALEVDHKEKMEKLVQQEKSRKETVEEDIRHEVHHGLAGGGFEPPHSPHRSSGSSKDQFRESVKKYVKSSPTRRRSPKEEQAFFPVDIDLPVPIPAKPLAAVVQQLEKDRNTRIQKEIKTLQAESIRLERQWKSSHHEEITRLKMQREREDGQLSHKQELIADQLSSLAVEKEELIRGNQELKATVREVEAEVLEVQKDLSVFTAGLSSRKQRLTDLDRAHTQTLHKSDCIIRQQEEDIHKQIAGFEASNKEAAEEFRVWVKNEERQHEECVEQMALQIKSDIQQKETEIRELIEQINTEKIKQERLEELCSKYADDNTFEGQPRETGAGRGSSSHSSSRRPSRSGTGSSRNGGFR